MHNIGCGSAIQTSLITFTLRDISHGCNQRKPYSARNYQTASKFCLCQRSRFAKCFPFRNYRKRVARQQSRQNRKYTGLRHIGTTCCVEQYGKRERIVDSTGVTAKRKTSTTQQGRYYTNEIVTCKHHNEKTEIRKQRTANIGLYVRRTERVNL